MTATVNIFTFSGVETLPVVAGREQRSDSVMALKEPMLGRDALSCTTGAADSSESTAAPAKTEVALVQVQPGKSVYYEIAPNGASLTTASSASRMMSGSNTFKWGPGWTISVLEVA